MVSYDEDNGTELLAELKGLQLGGLKVRLHAKLWERLWAVEELPGVAGQPCTPL